MTHFGMKLVMISPDKTYDFWWVDRSVC